MKHYEQIYNLVWILLGICIGAESVRTGLWGESGPEGGFFPFIAGSGMGMAGLGMFLLQMFRRMEDKSGFWEKPGSWNRILYVLLGFCVMAFLMPILGFLLTSILVTIFLFRLTASGGWVRVLAVGLSSCIFLYCFFNFLFWVNLPKGLLGI